MFSTRSDLEGVPSTRVHHPYKAFETVIDRVLSDLTVHNAGTLAAVAATLNGRPRKTLGWKTPAEALDQCLTQIENHGVATTG